MIRCVRTLPPGKALERLDHLATRLRPGRAPRRVADRPRGRRLAAGPRGPDRRGQDGRGDARLGGAPAAESRRHAPPARLVPADAGVGRPDGAEGRGVVRPARGRGDAREPPPRTGGRARAHGRRRRRRLAGGAGAPGGARGHPGHAAEPRADARLRLVPRVVADGVRAAPRGCAVGVRRGAAHGRGPRHLRAARSVPPRRSCAGGPNRPPADTSCPPVPQSVDLRDTRSAVARHRRSRRAGPRRRSSEWIPRRRRTAGSRACRAPPSGWFVRGRLPRPRKRPTSRRTSNGSPRRSSARTVPAE